MTYTDFVKSVESTSWHQPNERLLHAAMGLCTESAELIETDGDQHEIEELGDVCWYLALGFDALGADFDNAPILDEDKFLEAVRGEHSLDSLVLYSTDLLDLVKKQIFYGRVIDNERAINTLVMLKNIIHYGLLFADGGITLQDVIDANVKKLRARFPDKFSEDAANNRDVKEEYAAMSR